ncbi:hepatitis A virus cellular receptor 1 homolog isoform X2 [Pangasianodon hypophthalmus]|uniref:hepatitis A virus cellular receptor 1 homolog isoform X2 n=1 Tax=Pangasianodon hypophthalmus TaxID=310915 RepID=UPI001479B432|nr:hepatitis A virus cellular receptor 1 homolog isoform X2 [Pangasianodon hypophthalmus]
MPHFTMDQLHCWISSLGLLLCLTVCTCRSMTIYGFEGQDVTLPCKYDSRYHGTCDVCWMRGSIPTNGCGTQIIYANEKKVVMRSNVRYQLNGALQKGDASLTILKAKKSDSGKYGCRVHVPGWFNDKKIVVYLDIREATQRTFTTLGYVTTTTHIPTHAPVSTTQHETTSVPEHVTTKHTGPLTTQDDITTVPEHVTTEPTETQWTSSTLGYVTTTTHIATHGPVSTTQDETTTSPEHVTTKRTVVISENYPDAPSSEDNKHVNEEIDALPAILVPVILILLVLGISVVYLTSKHKRSFRTTLEIAKNSSTSVCYSNLDSSVTLPMINSSNN